MDTKRGTGADLGHRSCSTLPAYMQRSTTHFAVADSTACIDASINIMYKSGIPSTKDLQKVVLGSSIKWPGTACTPPLLIHFYCCHVPGDHPAVHNQETHYCQSKSCIYDKSQEQDGRPAVQARCRYCCSLFDCSQETLDLEWGNQLSCLQLATVGSANLPGTRCSACNTTARCTGLCVT